MNEPVIIMGRRQEGKTTRLIEHCARAGGYIVCRSFKDARRIQALATGMGMPIPFPLTYTEFCAGTYDKVQCSPLWIDDVGAFLAFMTTSRLGGFTVDVADE